jgi:hypothetical protein
MDATRILSELAAAERLPIAAIQAARANRDAVVPGFVRAIEQCVADRGVSEDARALFLVFHLLGEWREKSAYRPLAALLRLPTVEIEDVLGDATTETSHRVMAAVFDGDPAPLYEIIGDSAADEFIRARMCEAVAMLTLRGELPRAEAGRFLRACFDELEPQAKSLVWEGWQSAIAMLGLVELVPLVKQVSERAFNDPEWFRFEDFEADLQRALAGNPVDRGVEREFELFEDTVAELSTWSYVEAEEDRGEWGDDVERVADERLLWSPSEGPAVNPYRDVGRNDPCPCGSGKKFKKCCLGKVDVPSELDARARVESDSDFKDGVSGEPDLGAFEMTYDPLVAPDPDEWLALEEDERIEAVIDFHRRARIRLPNAKVHATAHVVVESQIAEGDALPVRRTLERLMRQGLDRHDAVHAIGMALMAHMNDLLKAGHVEGDPNARYFDELERLTADGWRRSG